MATHKAGERADRDVLAEIVERQMERVGLTGTRQMVEAAVREAWDAALEHGFEAGYEVGADAGYDLHIHDVSGSYPDGQDRDKWEQTTKAKALQEFAAALRGEKGKGGRS